MLVYLKIIIAFSCCFILVCRSGNYKSNNPVSVSAQDIQWMQQGLDSFMVYSIAFSPAEIYLPEPITAYIPLQTTVKNGTI
jgi:hypothetical protein